MQNYRSPEIINVGWCKDTSIAELADLISGIVGFPGRLAFDSSKPDGTPRKLLDTSRLTALGWQPRIELDASIASTYDWYLSNA